MCSLESPIFGFWETFGSYGVYDGSRLMVRRFAYYQPVGRKIPYGWGNCSVGTCDDGQGLLGGNVSVRVASHEVAHRSSWWNDGGISQKSGSSTALTAGRKSREWFRGCGEWVAVDRIKRWWGIYNYMYDFKAKVAKHLRSLYHEINFWFVQCTNLKSKNLHDVPSPPVIL